MTAMDWILVVATFVVAVIIQVLGFYAMFCAADALRRRQERNG